MPPLSRTQSEHSLPAPSASRPSGYDAYKPPFVRASSFTRKQPITPTTGFDPPEPPRKSPDRHRRSSPTATRHTPSAAERSPPAHAIQATGLVRPATSRSSSISSTASAGSAAPVPIPKSRVPRELFADMPPSPDRGGASRDGSVESRGDSQERRAGGTDKGGVSPAIRPSSSSTASATTIRPSRNRTTSLYGAPTSEQQHSQQSQPQASGVIAMAGPSQLSGVTSSSDRRHIKRDTSRRSSQGASTRHSSAQAAVAAVAGSIPARSSTSGPSTATNGAPSAAPSSSRPSASQTPAKTRSPEEERARAAARQAEKENWERTRGAGSSVLKLLDRQDLDPDFEWAAEDVLPSLDIVEEKKYEPVTVPSADLLLSRGIGDYTILPKVLGRGKFSTVFMASKNGELSAVKHTALFPHHQLISTRLLREPTLLAELPPHPNLVAVKETIRTPGHFYLVEEFLGGYVTLEQLIPRLSNAPAGEPPKLPFDVADKILAQLLSAVHAIHVPLQICHRDIKPENILVHPDSLQLKLLDFGLATHYSKSEPKLSTCCGSPAFHCPEIVQALASPPGSVSYWGPEVDAWTCGVTMLRCLTGARFPLGSTHSSLRSMAIRAQRAVATITDQGLREKVGALLEMDGAKRIKLFNALAAEANQGEAVAAIKGEAPSRGVKDFKSTTFIPTEPAHTMRLPLLVGPGADSVVPTPGRLASRRGTPSSSRAPSPTPTPPPERALPSSGRPLVLYNPSMQPPQRVLSFIKYCLRCAGILYHAWPDTSGTQSNAGSASGHGGSAAPDDPTTSPTTPTAALAPERPDGYAHVHVFQCVMELQDEQEEEEQLSLVQSIMAAFGRRPTGKRSMSTPAKPRAAAPSGGATGPAKATAGPSGKEGSIRCLTFFIVVRFPRSASRAAFSRTPSTAAFRDVSVNGRSESTSTARRARAKSTGGTSLAAPQSREPSLARTISASDGLSVARSDSPSAAPRQRSESRESASGALTPRHHHAHFASQPPSPGLPTHDLGLAVDSSHDRIRVNSSAGASVTTSMRSASASSSRAPSRASRHRSSRARRNRVFLHVTDERALDAVRKAMSVGGTTETSDVEDDSEQSVAEGVEPTTPARGDQRRRSRSALQRTSALAGGGGERGHSPAGGGFPFPVRDWDTDEDRGRSGKRPTAREARAPSRLSKEAVKEESPGHDDLAQAIDSLNQAMSHLAKPSSPAPSFGGTPGSSIEEQQQVRSLLQTMAHRLHVAEEEGPSSLEDALSPVSFQLFAALTPALGLEAPEALDLPSVGEAVAGDTTLRGLAMSSLKVVARHASPRELFMAAQERLQALAKESEPNSPAEQDSAEVGGGGGGVEVRVDSRVAGGPFLWCQALEVAGLLQILSIVVPRIGTKKPHNFVQPLASLIPRAVKVTLAATATMGEDEEQQARGPGQRQSAACAIAKGLCALTTATREWEQRSLSKVGSTGEPPSTDLLWIFLACIPMVNSDLPRLADTTHSAQTLAQYYFERYQPRFTPGGPPKPASLTPFEQANADIWTRLQQTVTVLGVDLAELAFGKKQAAPEALPAPGASSRTAGISLGAFLLHVQLFARRNTELTKWGSTQAHALLKDSLSLIVAALGSGPPPTTSSSGRTGTSGGSQLADAALTWLLWCTQALSKPDEGDDDKAGKDGAASPEVPVKLDEELLLPLVQAVSAHAALSPRPSSRLISYRILATLLERHTRPGLQLDLIRDLVCESPFPQLKLASLSLLREILRPLLKAGAASFELASPRLLEQLGPAIFAMPEGVPDVQTASTSPSTASAARAFLEESGGWMAECCNLVFFLLAADENSLTGIREASTLQRIDSELLCPVGELLDAWRDWAETQAAPPVSTQNSAKASPTSESGSGPGDRSPGQQTSDAGDILAQLGIIAVAHERASESVAKARAAGDA